MAIEKEHCDVLVIGGGIAALCAAISARNSGASVTLLNKGITGQSGSSPKAAGILAAPFGHGDSEQRPWEDGAAQYASDVLRVGKNINDPSLVKFVADEAASSVRWLEGLGVNFSKAPDGGFLQLNAPGNSRPRGCSAIGGGSAIIRCLTEEVRRIGVNVLDSVKPRQLLKDGKKVSGSLFQDKNDKTKIINSKATILAAGGATGLFKYLSGDQINTGGGLMLGFDAGAKVSNLDFVEFTLIYRVKGKPLRIAGLAPFMARGALLLNSRGNDLVEKYFPTSAPETVSRADLLFAVQNECQSSGGPVMLDARHFSNSTWHDFEIGQGAPVLDKLKTAGCNPKKELVEVLPAAHSILAGLVIDQDAATTVTGLYAAGENATGIHGAGRLSGNGLTSSVVMGRVAGKKAAAHSDSEVSHTTNYIDQNIQETIKITKKDRNSLEAIKLKIREAAESGLGVIRNEKDIKAAMDTFAAMEKKLQKFNLENPTTFEIWQMTRLASMMASAALEKQMSHYGQ